MNLSAVILFTEIYDTSTLSGDGKVKFQCGRAGQKASLFSSYCAGNNEPKILWMKGAEERKSFFWFQEFSFPNYFSFFC